MRGLNDIEYLKIQNKLIKENIKEYGKNYSLCLFCLLIFFIGGIMNFMVIASNHYRMPVSSDTNIYHVYLKGVEYFSFTDNSDVQLAFLADRIPIMDNLFSLGDIVLIIGFFGFIFFVIRGNKIYKNFKKMGVEI